MRFHRGVRDAGLLVTLVVQVLCLPAAIGLFAAFPIAGTVVMGGQLFSFVVVAIPSAFDRPLKSSAFVGLAVNVVMAVTVARLIAFHGLPLLVGAPILGATIVVSAVLVTLWLHERRRSSTGCRECGYDLRSSVRGICPECGAPWRQDQI